MADENEILAQLDTARKQVTALTGERDAARGQVAQLTTDLTAARTQVTAITVERDTAKGQIAQLTADRDSLNTQLTAANVKVAGLEASQKDFDARLASEVAKKGIRTTAVAGDTTDPNKGLSLTDRCRAVTGGKDQLEGKRS